MVLHYDIRITGRVQGVFFRASARAEAERLSVRGFVRNERDGSVYAEAEGDRESLDRFVAWCRRGPAHARVDGVTVEERPGPAGYRDFTVR